MPPHESQGTGPHGQSRRRRPQLLPGDERGSALVFALIALLVVSVLATAGLNLSGFELNTSRDFQTHTRAFYMADRGLNQYMVAGAPSLVTSTTYQFSGGHATIQVDTVARDLENGENLYRVTSTGEYVAPGGERVQRRVSQLFMTTPLLTSKPPSAVVSGGGTVQKGGPSARFCGNSAAGVLSLVTRSLDVKGKGKGGKACPGGGGPPGNKGGNSGKKGGPKCKPGGLNVPDGVNCTTNPFQGVMTKEQWKSLRSIPADVRYPEDRVPSMGSGQWKVVKADGNATLTTSGQGFLIVDGNLDTGGGFSWNGLVLVGGKVIGKGNMTVDGAMITGLNTLMGDSIGGDDFRGNKNFYYDPTYVDSARMAGHTMSAVPASWHQLQQTSSGS